MRAVDGGKVPVAQYIVQNSRYFILRIAEYDNMNGRKKVWGP